MLERKKYMKKWRGQGQIVKGQCHYLVMVKRIPLARFIFHKTVQKPLQKKISNVKRRPGISLNQI